MKILVCISNVPDTTTKITFTDNNTKFNTQGVQYIINPYDELALTRALELTEKSGGTVSVISVGLAIVEPSIRKALAIGASDAIRINAEPTNAYFVAQQIAEFVKNESYDLIMTGRESIDHNGAMVCGLLAEFLDLPSVNAVTHIEIEDSIAIMDRDIDGGKEKLKCKFPLVLSAQKDLAEPRIPNMRGIMGARTKPLKVLEPLASIETGLTTAFELPPAKSQCKYLSVEDAGKIIELLHSEAKVI